MNEAKLERKQEAPSIEFVDCGRASEKTRGVPLILFFELGLPPFDKLFLI